MSDFEGEGGVEGEWVEWGVDDGRRKSIDMHGIPWFVNGMSAPSTFKVSVSQIF